MYSTTVEKLSFLSAAAKSIPVIKLSDASNFMLTLDGIGPFLQIVKSLEPLKIKKQLIYPIEVF